MRVRAIERIPEFNWAVALNGLEMLGRAEEISKPEHTGQSWETPKADSGWAQGLQGSSFSEWVVN